MSDAPGEVIRVGKQRAADLNSTISVDAAVVEAGPVEPFCYNAAFECTSCYYINQRRQQPGEMQKPERCEDCGNPVLRFNLSESDLIDHQKILTKPPNSTLEDPPKLIVFLRGDDCDTVEEGDRLTISGTYKAFQKQKESVLSTYLRATKLHERDDITVDADAADIGDVVVDYVDEHMRDDGYGVARSEVVEEVSGDRFRRPEVEDTIDELAAATHHDLQDVDGRLAIASTHKTERVE